MGCAGDGVGGGSCGTGNVCLQRFMDWVASIVFLLACCVCDETNVPAIDAESAIY